MHSRQYNNIRHHARHREEDGPDEYDIFDGDGEADEPSHDTPKVSGPLSRRPAFTSLYPALILSLLFVVCTNMFNSSAYHDWLWAARPEVFNRHEFWRLLVALFTHSGPVHLLSNMPFFIFFGLVLYDYFGFLFFPALPLLLGVCSNAMTLYLYADDVHLVGASGMIYGMVGLWLVLYIRHDTARTIPARIFMAAGFTLAVMFPETYTPSTSYLAHATGFITGIMCGIMALPFARVKVRAGTSSELNQH